MPTPAPPVIEQYVALGDSYAAGPMIPTTELETGCFRSDHNYPSLLARKLELTDVRDVSCSGAQTGDLPGRQRTPPGPVAPPQLDALSADTDLVTVTIGGNDLGLYSRALRGLPSPGLADKVGPHVASALALIRAKAPNALVVLVGYLRLVEPGAGCVAKLPFTETQRTAAYVLQERLSAAQGRAAQSVGVPFVDMFSASRGHGICSDEPWVNGRFTRPGEAVAYHPFLAGMEATAREIERTLSLQP